MKRRYTFGSRIIHQVNLEDKRKKLLKVIGIAEKGGCGNKGKGAREKGAQPVACRL